MSHFPLKLIVIYAIEILDVICQWSCIPASGRAKNHIRLLYSSFEQAVKTVMDHSLVGSQ
jgi:hypothetical protein